MQVRRRPELENSDTDLREIWLRVAWMGWCWAKMAVGRSTLVWCAVSAVTNHNVVADIISPASLFRQHLIPLLLLLLLIMMMTLTDLIRSTNDDYCWVMTGATFNPRKPFIRNSIWKA